MQESDNHDVLSAGNKESSPDDKTHENIKLSAEVDHIFLTPVAMSTPTKKSNISEVDSVGTDSEVGYISCEASFTTDNEMSPEKQIPQQNVTTKERAQVTLSDVACHKQLTDITAQETVVGSHSFFIETYKLFMYIEISHNVVHI